METCNFTEWHETRQGLEYLTKLAGSFVLSEADSSHYSVEVNYRTTKKEILESYAKLVLGYVSAAMKKHGYHCKHIFTDKPMRILVATRNWDDGEWVAVLCYNPHHCGFVLSSGYWNKDRRTVTIHDPATKKLDEDDAAKLTTKLVNYLHELKYKDPRKVGSLKPAPMKRGPKK
jgi:hypothetical protein